MFKDMFTVKERKDRIRRNSDMTINESPLGRLLKTIRKFKNFSAQFQLAFAKGNLVPKYFLKQRFILVYFFF